MQVPRLVVQVEQVSRRIGEISALRREMLSRMQNAREMLTTGEYTVAEHAAAFTELQVEWEHRCALIYRAYDGLAAERGELTESKKEA